MTDLIRAHIIKLHGEGLSQRAIAERVGRAQSSVNAILKDAALKGELGFVPVLPGFKVTRITSKGADGESIVQRPAADDGELVLPPGQVLDRTSIKHGDSWFKTKRADPEALTKDDFLEVFSEIRGKSNPLGIAAPLCNADLLTVYPIADLHVGMLAWGRETGTAWDLKIARETSMATITELVDCAPPSATGVLLDLGDYTHNNNQDNVTPGHKHQLDVDGRFPKIGKDALRLRRDMVNLLLRKHERVIVRGLSGNHDPDVAPLFSAAFSLFYENNPRVEVDDDSSSYWFHEFGVNMLAANHGDKLKADKLPGVMASQREMWGRTRVRQAWSGHIHHTTAGEGIDGARWETLRTMAAKDAYAHQHGFRSGRELTAWTYHRERGLRHRQVAEIL